MMCFECPFNKDCEHLNGLYQIDLGHVFVVCNSCGRVVFHGSKKKCNQFVLLTNCIINKKQTIAI
jgi:hypothetical protein